MHETHEQQGKACCIAGRPATPRSGGPGAGDGRLVDGQELGRQAARPPVLDRPHGIPRDVHMGGGPTLRERDHSRRRIERAIEQLEREYTAAYNEETWADWKAGRTTDAGREAEA